jgi:hypothetical protein
MSIHRSIPVAGFLAVAPFLPDVHRFVPPLVTGESALRGYLIVGKEDPQSLAGARALAEHMQLQGLACKVEVQPRMGHDYPEDFAASLMKGLQFLTEG